jgi:hypothetical protein
VSIFYFLNGLEGPRDALIPDGYKPNYIKGLHETRNRKPALQFCIQDPYKNTENAIRPWSSPEEGLRHRLLSAPPGNKPLGAQPAWVVDDEPERNLPVEVEVMEKGRPTAIRYRGKAVTPA